MSEKVIKPLLIVGAIAVNAVPGVGQAISAATFGALSATAATMAITSLGVTAATSLVAGKPSNKTTLNQLERLNASINPSAPAKIWFGATAGATDIRYVEPSGANQEFVDYIIVTSASRLAGRQSDLHGDLAEAWAA